MMIRRADPTADPADIAGKCGQNAARSSQTVGMIPLVWSAPAPGDHCRSGSSVLFRKILDDRFGDLGNLCCPGSSVFLRVLPQSCKNRLQLRAGKFEVSLQFRRNAGHIVGLERIGVLVPYLILAVRLQQLFIVGPDQKGRRTVFAQIVLIVPAVRKHLLDQRQHKGRVRSRPKTDPLVTAGRCGRVGRIDGNDFGPGFLGIIKKLRVRHRGFQ